ncbi:hypothetical protein [Paenibacillus glycanilyticus]|uniref:hypothetical protein n=1 Tax=Paenibacillus glycanilyticus TaxID=126569 RepID=UPI000FD94491|nr:hypothetical protein [Paenibacillus glycanilyticus]
MDGTTDSSSTSVRHLTVPMAAIIVGMFIVYLDQTVLLGLIIYRGVQVVLALKFGVSPYL